MEIEKYYEMLNPAENDRILVVGDKSLPIALYLAGASQKDKKNVKCYALISEGALIQSDFQEIEIAKKKYSKNLSLIEEGLPFTSFEKTDLLSFSSREKFTKCVIKKDKITSRELMKLSELMKGNVLLVIPLLYTGLFEVTEKKMFGSKKQKMGFAKALEKAGFKVQSFSVIEDKVVINASFEKLNESVLKNGLEKVDAYETAKSIVNEIEKHVRYTVNRSTFALESEDKDYIFIVSVQDTSNQPFNYTFKFLYGNAEHQSGEQKSRSKSFKVIVLPNTKEFRREIEEKEILIVGKTKLLQIFGEQYKPI